MWLEDAKQVLKYKTGPEDNTYWAVFYASHQPPATRSSSHLLPCFRCPWTVPHSSHDLLINGDECLKNLNPR